MFPDLFKIAAVMGVLNADQIREIGFGHVGKAARISDKASFYNPANIRIGDHTRIDDFCVLSAGEGGIEIGRNVHIAVYTSLIGKGRITLCDFANISSRVAIYSSNDDYSGEWMTNPTVNEAFTNVSHADVTIGRHVIIGSGSVVLPGVEIGEGAAIGSLSLVNRSCLSFGIYAGIPAQKKNERSKGLLDKEQAFLDSAHQ